MTLLCGLRKGFECVAQGFDPRSLWDISSKNGTDHLHPDIRGTTRGLQNEDYVNRVVKAVKATLQSMAEGDEVTHFEWFIRHVGLRGTNIRIGIPEEKFQKEVVYPYPAFRYLWRTVIANRWSRSQRINILEAAAILVEFRKRFRFPDYMK